MEGPIFTIIERSDARSTRQNKFGSSEKHKEISIMDAKNYKVDVDTIDFFIRKAHTERSVAITDAFGGLADMVKNIFTAPDAGNMARGH